MALAVAGKDLRSEWRGRELLPALAQFIILAVVIANFAFDLDLTTGPRLSPGILWLVLVFAGLVAFGRTFAAEREQASLEAMLLTPAAPTRSGPARPPTPTADPRKRHWRKRRSAPARPG